MLRDHRGDVRIGFFNHIPFPPYELFARIPWRSEIVNGLLGADLLGFQRQLGAQNFMASARRLLRAQISGTEVRRGDRVTRVGTYPISIDVEEFETLAAGRATRRRASSIRARLGDPEVILLGVDRLDYTKGIGNRLRTFGSLLDTGRLDPERHVLVQVATPTREGVDQYRDERYDIERTVGEVNGRHARLGYPVIHYLYRTLPLDELVPLYRAADVLLVTPFRDGMNLVAKEFVATRLDDDGVLVLSEFTGAADELSDAVLVNPHNERQFEDAIMTAVDMNRHERRERMVAMRAAVRSSDVAGWARDFLNGLNDGLNDES
jgi:trehalose-6-phosphate synthase